MPGSRPIRAVEVIFPILIVARWADCVAKLAPIRSFNLAWGRQPVAMTKRMLEQLTQVGRIDLLMIVVHDIFVCKPGNASKLAKLFKEWADAQKQTYVMTDMTGQWHRVIVASTHDSLAAYEENFKKMMADTPENRVMNEKFKDVNDMYVSGSREIYKVW